MESGEVGKWESCSEERVDLSTHKGRDRRDQFYFRHTAYPGFLNIRAGIIGSISYHKSILPYGVSVGLWVYATSFRRNPPECEFYGFSFYWPLACPGE